MSTTACDSEGEAGRAERAIFDSAKAAPAEFTIPQSAAPSAAWERLLILCPYARPPFDASAALAEAAAKIDTDETDGSQWLVFEDSGTVDTVTLSRSRIDFCTTEGSAGREFTPTSVWSSSASEGTLHLGPRQPN